jgi:hypothetical protein
MSFHHGLGGWPVVDNSRTAGIPVRRDFFRTMARQGFDHVRLMFSAENPLPAAIGAERALDEGLDVVLAHEVDRESMRKAFAGKLYLQPSIDMCARVLAELPSDRVQLEVLQEAKIYKTFTTDREKALAWLHEFWNWALPALWDACPFHTLILGTPGFNRTTGEDDFAGLRVPKVASYGSHRWSAHVYNPRPFTHDKERRFDAWPVPDWRERMSDLPGDKLDEVDWVNGRLSWDCDGLFGAFERFNVWLRKESTLDRGYVAEWGPVHNRGTEAAAAYMRDARLALRWLLLDECLWIG